MTGEKPKRGRRAKDGAVNLVSRMVYLDPDALAAAKQMDKNLSLAVRMALKIAKQVLGASDQR